VVMAIVVGNSVELGASCDTMLVLMLEVMVDPFALVVVTASVVLIVVELCASCDDDTTCDATLVSMLEVTVDP